MKIPKIIHQTWKTRDIPYDIYKKEWVDSWKKYHPDWEYRLWTDEDNRELIKRHYPEFLEVYDGYPAGINRADAARYFILNHYGGLYVDLDFECFKSFEPLLNDYDLVLGRMKSDYLVRHCIPNALMASIPRHPFWQSVIRALSKRKDMNCVELATGPAMLSTTLVRYQVHLWFMRMFSQKESCGIKVFGSKYFYPVTWRKMSIYHGQTEGEIISSVRKNCPDAYASTYWCHNW